jgi:rubrerythrin
VNRVPNPTLGRRTLIRNGAITVSLGAITAACGTGRTGSTDPGRLGVGDQAPELLDEEITDLTLMRTAQSLEYTALDVYAAAAATDALGSGESALVERFVEDHQRHAEAVGAIIVGLDGEPFECANPFLVERAVIPILGAIDGSDDLPRDLLQIAYAFEQLAAASYQSLVSMLVDRQLRTSAMTIGTEENRHAAALAAALTPDTYFSPALTGGQEGTDERGIPSRYAIPSVFGQVSGIELTVGPVTDEGSRFTTQLQTPAANSLVYSDDSC